MGAGHILLVTFLIWLAIMAAATVRVGPAEGDETVDDAPVCECAEDDPNAGFDGAGASGEW